MKTTVERWQELTEGYEHYTPQTVVNASRYLQQFEDFLREDRGLTRLDRVKIEDVKAFLKYLRSNRRKEKFGRKLSSNSRVTVLSYITMYYELEADEDLHGRWPNFVAQLKRIKRPKVRGASSPHEPYPLKMIPEILDAAGECEDPEVRVLVALLTYTGMRAQAYGLRVEELHFDDRLIRPLVKGAEAVVPIPMHVKLTEILREHLETREYESEMLFRLGRFPYKFIDGDGSKDARSMESNRDTVRRHLGFVERVLKKRGVRVHLVCHKFRKSLETYGSQYRHMTSPPFDETDGRLLLAHGAKTITQQYDMRKIAAVRDKWDQMDLGSREWVEMALSGVMPEGGQSPPNNGSKQAMIERLMSLPEEKLEALEAFLKTMEA
jgi:integrase